MSLLWIVVLRSIYREDPLTPHLPTPTKRPLERTNYATFNKSFTNLSSIMSLHFGINCNFYRYHMGLEAGGSSNNSEDDDEDDNKETYPES